MKFNSELLLTPGPTLTSSKSKKIMGLEVFHHRSERAWNIRKDTNNKLLHIANTSKSENVIFTSSGTGAMEASIVNFVNTNDKILAFDTGFFSKRLINIAKSYNLNVDVAYSYDEFEKMTQNKEYSIFLLTHHQTTTGELLNLKFFSKLKNENTIIILDSISAFGVHELKMDEWDIDVVSGASQKGFDVPPGISFMIYNVKALEKSKTKNLPSYYFNLDNLRPFSQKNESFTTMPMNLLEAFNSGLTEMINFGITNKYMLYEERKKYLLKLLKKHNIKYLDFGKNNGNVVTSLIFEKDMTNVILKLHKKYNIRLIGGYDKKVIRIAHIGNINIEEYDYVIKSLLETIGELNEK